MLSRGATVFIALLVVMAAHVEAGASTLACLPGVEQRVYAFRYVPLPKGGADALHASVGDYAKRSKLSVGGVGSVVPGAQRHADWTAILQTESFGTVFAVTTTPTSKYAKVTVGNNCWAKREDWRPHWARLNHFLDRTFPWR